MAQMNLGLIGAGRIGRMHASTLSHRVPAANLLMVADVALDAATAVAAQHNVPHAVADYRRVLDHPDIEAVVICSATHTHAQIIEEAAAAGKHIFCEKPIDLSLERIDRALAAVERVGVKLQVGFNRRFDANYRRVRKAIIEGEIGRPHLMHIISRDPAPPPLTYIQVSGGIFLDMTIHDFDMARFLMGCEVTEVYAAGGVLVDPQIGAAGDLDTVLITLKFENGAFGVIDNSRRAVYGYDQRVEVLGSRGGITTANNFPNTAVVSTAESVRRDLPLNFFIERYVDSYIDELDAFVAAVLQDTPVPVTGYDGRMPVVMGLAARRSYDENRPVCLTEIMA